MRLETQHTESSAVTPTRETPPGYQTLTPRSGLHKIKRVILLMQATGKESPGNSCGNRYIPVILNLPDMLPRWRFRPETVNRRPAGDSAHNICTVAHRLRRIVTPGVAGRHRQSVSPSFPCHVLPTRLCQPKFSPRTRSCRGNALIRVA